MYEVLQHVKMNVMNIFTFPCSKFEILYELDYFITIICINMWITWTMNNILIQ